VHAFGQGYRPGGLAVNRKERRAAQKQGKSAGTGAPFQALSPAPSVHLFASAVQHLRAGQMAEAERLCREVLAIEPNHFDGLHLLGIIAHNVGRNDDAAQFIARAIAVNGRSPECHFNLAQVLRALRRWDEAAAHFIRATDLKHDYAAAHMQLGHVRMQQGQLDEAAERYRRTLALDPRAVEAHYGLGNVAMARGRLDAAAEHYRNALALKPDHAQSCNNLGIALAGQGRWDEAAAQYRRALALKPDLVDVHRNLGRVLMAQGDAGQALAIARRALEISETVETKAFFVQCAKSLPAAPADEAFRGLITRALSEGWTRPGELAALAADLFRRSDAGRSCVERAVAAWPRRLAAAELWDADERAAVSGDRLLRALLESAPVCDIALERFLTSARSAVLDMAASSTASSAVGDDMLGFACAVAQQCFINEYVFAATAPERLQALRLQETLEAALRSAAPVPTLWLAAVAAYVPLHALAPAPSLLERSWPEPLLRLLDRQIHQPLAERDQSIPALTAIDDEVSRKVRRQYEDMPYPRWVTTAPVGNPTTVDWYLRNRFPLSPLRDLGKRDGLDILVAGCGTGQHSIETAQRFLGAKVLAIDLSQASLRYAKSKTRALGLDNIDYAQADILALGAIGRTFDLVEAIGVLHHLGDPAKGWRVLLSLLRPGGLMHVGLYSAPARQDVRAARAFIAERGYGLAADDIRRCRQDILETADGTPLKDVTRYADFFTTSECRDLLFHVEEHQLTIPQIRSFLVENDLTFIGFASPADAAYRQRFPDDKAMTDLDNWHVLETENPKLFVNMYQFWVQKPARG
jgi:Tfp pilus assembly protein PilF/SAM-dependent methyltransferase